MLSNLYKKGKKGEIRIWKIRTEGSSIITEHGVLDGKMQVSKKTAKSKNLGRSNETTADEQAILEAQSMWTKQKDKGYFESIEKANTERVFLPMLASKLEDKKHKLSYPCICQPKMDGVRALCYWDGDEVKLMSRGGKQYSVKHITDFCKELLKPNEVLDGELYIHGIPLQDINSLVKKPQEGSADLEYWVYDMFLLDDLSLNWNKRLDLLESNFYYKIEDSNVKRVPWGIIFSEEKIKESEKFWVERGFEGAIIRDFEGTYELGKRSSYLLKVKSFLDDEYKIVGYKEGDGKFEGCVIWECVTEEGKPFHATPKGTMEQRAEWYRDGDKYIGKWLTVKYFQLTKDNIPQFPVGLSIRLEEDM